MGITVNFTKSEQYTLSFRLGTDGFSFSIYNPIQEDSLTVIEREVDSSLSLTANLKSAFRELEFLSYSYKRINIMITGKRFTTIPLELFEDEQAEVIFHHNHPNGRTRSFSTTYLKRIAS